MTLQAPSFAPSAPAPETASGPGSAPTSTSVSVSTPPPAGAPAGAQAVRRALDVLRCFQDYGPEPSASDLARRLGLSTSTAHRLARTLLAAGFLEQDPRTARYRLGPVVTELGRISYHQRGLHLAGPELRDLAERTGGTVALALRGGAHAVTVAGGTVTPRTSLRRPLRATAPGRVLLAWPGPGEPADAADPQGARIRERGHLLAEDEPQPGARTLAVPVLDRDGRARFALAVRAEARLLSDARLDWFLARTTACARALEVLLLPPGERRVPEA
ncbi:IclR family transcriptional regulator [Streptomyces sp. NPDC015232]|uniref:IclR family transcriptional regulator n=1 Tax=unclassified Streptomyces TaxID=2593676 RepID=UPI0036FE01EC